jgi:hypothetical protein
MQKAGIEKPSIYFSIAQLLVVEDIDANYVPSTGNAVNAIFQLVKGFLIKVHYPYLESRFEMSDSNELLNDSRFTNFVMKAFTVRARNDSR